MSKCQYERQMYLCATGRTTVEAEVELPVDIAEYAKEIAENSDNPEKHVGDFLDSACLLDVTYCVDGEPIDIINEKARG